MNKNNVVSFENPAKSVVQDYLTNFLRESVQKMLAMAIVSAATTFAKIIKQADAV